MMRKFERDSGHECGHDKSGGAEKRESGKAENQRRDIETKLFLIFRLTPP